MCQLSMGDERRSEHHSDGTGPLGVGVNSTTNRIYVTNREGNNVSVIDGSTEAVVQTVPVGLSPHGLAVNPTTHRVYVANLASGDVSVIDGATNTVVATVSVGQDPWRVAATTICTTGWEALSASQTPGAFPSPGTPTACSGRW